MQSLMQKFTANMVNDGKIAGGTVSVSPDVVGGTINTLIVDASIRAYAEIEAINIGLTFTYGA